MITNADVTVYNRISGDSTHYDTWIRTILHGVHVHVDHKTAVTDNGLKSAEVYKIRIPADIPEAGQYLPPDQFACRSESRVPEALQGDKLVGQPVWYDSALADRRRVRWQERKNSGSQLREAAYLQ